MCSGTSSWGRATMPRGKSGKSRTTLSGIALESRQRRSACLRRRDDEVVEDGRWQARLEQPAVDLLESEVAAEGVDLPRPRHLVRVGGRLQGAVGPAEPVGQQLLAADADVVQSGAPGHRGELVGGEGV